MLQYILLTVMLTAIIGLVPVVCRDYMESVRNALMDEEAEDNELVCGRRSA